VTIETWIVRDANKHYKIEYHEGWLLTFGSNVFYFGQHDPDPGNYLVAVMVEDMDGERYYEFAQLAIHQ
jgi:hypothetical protein